MLLALGLTTLLSQAQQPDGPPPVVEEKLWTPESSVFFALADLKTIPPEQQQYIRYLSLHNIPAAKRDEYAKIVSFVVNSLGTRRKIYIPVFVGASEKTVIRLNIKDYDWNPESWEKLAREGSGPRPFPEPYFHTLIVDKAEIKFKTITQKKTVTKQVEKLVQVGVYQNTGAPYYEKRLVKEDVEIEEQIKVPIEQKIKKEKLASAPWINADVMADFIALTQSEAPIVRADWFITYATLAPAYYNFLNLGNKVEDFEKLVFTDLKLAEKARSQDRAVIVMSGISRNNRRVRRSPTFTGGYYWETFDVLNSIKGNKALLNLLDDKHDASEYIGTLPNGLQAYFLANGDGARQDEAPINIVLDNSAVDRVVRSARSCIVCHSEGIKTIDDEVRALNKWNPNHDSIQLLITKEQDAYKVQDLFGSDLERQVTKDMQIYQDAVALTNGMKTQALSKSYGLIYDNYLEHLMNKEDVAREFALNFKDLDGLLKLSNDPILLGLLREPIRPLRRDQFEESYQGFMLIVVASKLRPGEVPRIIIPEKLPLRK